MSVIFYFSIRDRAFVTLSMQGTFSFSNRFTVEPSLSNPVLTPINFAPMARAPYRSTSESPMTHTTSPAPGLAVPREYAPYRAGFLPKAAQEIRNGFGLYSLIPPNAADASSASVAVAICCGENSSYQPRARNGISVSIRDLPVATPI